MDIYHTIIRPLVTEKTNKHAQSSTDKHGPTYYFQVHEDATKPQVRDAIQKIYGVKVHSVRTLNRFGKARRFQMRYGKPHGWKRAAVTLETDNAIDLF